MTFTELQTEILDRLNLSSTDAQTRVGRAINRIYRKVTTAIGLQLSRRTTTTANTTIGSSSVTFANTEKVITVVNRNVSPYRTLQEVTLDEIQEDQAFASGDAPTMYAVKSHTSDTVTVTINRLAATVFALHADVHQAVADLSGSNEPAFPESFHDVIIEGVMADELRKMEKPALAKIAKDEYESTLSDLRMWIAKTGYIDIYQGKTSVEGGLTGSSFGGGSGGGGGGGVISGSSSYTQTGLVTFDRDPLAPFVVSAGSAVVSNLFAQYAATLNPGRTINGVLFDGSANITVTAAAGTLTGTILAANVVTSSLNAVGTLTTGATGAGFTIALSASTVTGSLADARLSSNVPLKNTVNAFTAFGTHSIIAGGTGASQFSLRNTTAGTGNYARVALGNDTDSLAGTFDVFSSTWTTTGPYLAEGTSIGGHREGGLSVAATHASGDIRFYTGGTAIRGQITEAGIFSWLTAGTHTFSGGVNGIQGFFVENTTSNTAAVARYALQASTTAGYLIAFSEGHTSSGTDIPSSVFLYSAGSAGLSVGATHATGSIRFYTGGTTLRGSISSAGAWTIGAYTLPTADGTNDQVLTTNGSGAVTWTAKAGGGGTGITTLEGQTGATQTFGDDTNVTIVSSGDNHQLTWAGTLGVARGGTNLSSYAVGDIIYASASTTLAKLADVATGNALISGGVTTAPSWGKIGLTTHVSGTLPVANGGTNAAAFTAGSVVFAGASGTYTEDNANFFWNNTDNRLGLGTATPPNLLSVVGSGSFGLIGGTQTALAPLSSWINPGVAGALITQHAILAHIGDDTDSGAVALQNDGSFKDFVGINSVVTSNTNRNNATTPPCRIFAMNTTTNVNAGYDCTGVGCEFDINNLGSDVTAPDGALAKNGVGVVFGGGAGGVDAAYLKGSAYFIAQSPRAGGGAHYGYWVQGATDAAFHCSRTRGGATPIDPTYVFNNTSLGNILIQSTGTHAGAIINVDSTAIGGADYYEVTGHGNTNISSPDQTLIQLNYTGAANPHTQVLFLHSLVTQGSITTGSGATAYNTSSDRRIKKNIAPLHSALDQVMRLKPSTYEMIGYEGVTHQGLIADEVAEVLPLAVFGEKDAVDKDGNIVVQQLAYDKLIPMMIGAIQELQKQLTELRAE